MATYDNIICLSFSFAQIKLRKIFVHDIKVWSLTDFYINNLSVDQSALDLTVEFAQMGPASWSVNTVLVY